jgi:hypothetical protein
MAAPVNHQILLKSRPEGAPSLDNFTLKQGSVPEPGYGEVADSTPEQPRSDYLRTFTQGGVATSARGTTGAKGGLKIRPSANRAAAWRPRSR